VLVGRWVVKRLVPTRRRRLVLDRLRPGKAIRALRLAFLLEISGVPTARVAASGRLVSGGLVRRSYVVSELVPEASHVDVALTATSDRANLFGRIGEAIGRLHKEGLAHRDLKAGNLLVDAAGDVILVDLDGVRMVRDLGPERAAADLARLFRDLRGRADATSAEERGLLDAWSGWTAMDVDAIARRIERQRRLRPRGT
jgi:tRNA A-37 threonylcarbamoyl transferase component Bud32